jgi:hypothetical protein
MILQLGKIILYFGHHGIQNYDHWIVQFLGGNRCDISSHRVPTHGGSSRNSADRKLVHLKIHPPAYRSDKCPQ